MSDSNPSAGKMFNYRPARSHYRSRSHDTAHNESSAPVAEMIRHALVPRGDAALLTTDAELADFIGHAREAGSFAYDSEFIGELTYVPKLCLFQVATSQRVALIDPLASIDLRPFWELICDASVEKIVHAGQQDLEPVIRHLGGRPANVIDTQIAAAFIGMSYPVSLSKLVRELVGAKLAKGMTFTHWDQRPLSGSQLRYAADDVRYLPAVWSAIHQQLEKLGHTAWAREECDGLCDPALYRFDPQTQYLRVRGATSLQPIGMAILRELTVWRDGAARAHDVPPRAFLKDEILIDLARSPVKSLEKLDRVRGLPRPIELAHGKEIIEATARALATPPTDLPTPRHIEEGPFEEFRAEAIWAACEVLCIGRSIAPSLVVSRQDIGKYYRQVVKGEAAEDVKLLRGWRLKAIAEPLSKMINGESTFTLRWSEGGLRAE